MKLFKANMELESRAFEMTQALAHSAVGSEASAALPQLDL